MSNNYDKYQKSNLPSSFRATTANKKQFYRAKENKHYLETTLQKDLINILEMKTNISPKNFISP